jgi:diguanylate cyclase (GGDEF)-like protein
MAFTQLELTNRLAACLEPAAPCRDAAAITEPVALPMPRPYRCTVLVVASDAGALEENIALLRQDFEVVTARTADAARQAWDRQDIDLLLLGPGLPAAHRGALLDWVSQQHPRTATVLVLDGGELTPCLKGPDRAAEQRYLLVPCGADELLHVVRAAVSHRQLEHQHGQLVEQLHRLNTELERRVVERTRQLQEANVLLQQRAHELKRLALTDPLTGLFNRRAMEELLRFELKRHARYPSPLTVGLVDVDHFKRINTAYLLTGGDAVLRGLARLLSSTLREVDSVGRLGGEEFLVIARETNEDGAHRLAERIRQAVASTPFCYEDQPISITVSLGLTVADVEVPADFETMTRQAAFALNLAKKKGRNRYEICPASPAALH